MDRMEIRGRGRSLPAESRSKREANLGIVCCADSKCCVAVRTAASCESAVWLNHSAIFCSSSSPPPTVSSISTMASIVSYYTLVSIPFQNLQPSFPPNPSSSNAAFVRHQKNPPSHQLVCQSSSWWKNKTKNKNLKAQGREVTS